MTAFQSYFVPQYRTTTLDKVGGLTAGETAGIKLASIPSDVDITQPGILCLTYSNPIDTTVAEWITYTSIDGTNVLQGVTRGAEGWSAKTHLNNCTIAWVFSKSHVNELMKVLTGVTTGAKLDSAKIVTALMDTNGNELLKVTATASAVNELTLANGATGGNPKLSATGGDTNIGITLAPKGSGVVAIDGALMYGADAGSTDDYAITVTGVSAYATGQVFVFKANTANTGAATLNVNSLGAKTIKKNYNSDLATNDVLANQLVKVIYDGTNFQLLSPVSNSSGSTDGWTADSNTWTYASASTFTVSGDVTSQFKPGTRLKFTQTTVKYAVVVSSSYGAPNTTVTIAVNTDYTIANAAISSTYYSYHIKPPGYPPYFNFTTTLTKPTGMTGTPSVQFSVFQIIGGWCHVKQMWSGTFAGTVTGTSWTMSLPVNAISIAGSPRYTGAGYAERVGAAITIIYAYSDLANMQLRMYNNAAFANGDQEYDADLWYPMATT